MQFRDGQLDRGAVIGGYRIDEMISRGGMGIVYRATNVALNRIYAIKVLAPELSDDEQFRERFKREIRIAASLHHPHVVGIHYAGEHEGLLFFVMDFIYGTDLSQMLRKTGALEPERAVEILTQLASALDAAHHKGLVHRDVKPANVLVTVRDGEESAYLTDFGLAKRSDTIGGMTRKGVVVGTVDYMAPEQITGGQTDARTDIYALGCTLFHMLSGKVPYERENSVATLFAHVHDPPPPLEAPLLGTYPALGEVVRKAMAKAPSDRYFSAGDLAAAAAAALRGMAFTQPSTVVATGEARPLDAPGPAPSPEPEPILPAPGSTTAPDAEPTVGASAMAAPPLAPGHPGFQAPPPATPAAVPPAVEIPMATRSEGDRSAGPSHAGTRRYAWLGILGLVLIGAIAAVIIASSGGSSPPASAPAQRYGVVASPVPTNRVTGAGSATIVVRGNVATVTVDTNGLLDAAHLMHIHGGSGKCPTAAAARRVNGVSFVSASAGDQVYGGVVASLTEHGTTSPAVHGIATLFPSGGTIRYTRTLTLSPGVAAEMRQGLAVIVVHGIDYNSNGTYDDSLGPEGEASAPALCGALFPAPSAAAGSDPSSGVVYAATLHRSGGHRVASLWLLCHLRSRTATVAASRAGRLTAAA